MTEFIQFAIFGLGVGAVYALLAQGVIAIYRGSGVLNFAQGAMAMFGAYIYSDLREAGWPFVPSFVLAVGALVAIGVATHFLVMRPLRRSSGVSRVIATLGILLILQAVAILIWGSNVRLVSFFLPSDVIDVGNDIVVPVDRIILVGIAIGLSFVLWFVAKRTTFGLATTAVAENLRGSSALGWSPDLIAAANWGVGAGLAATAGIIVAPLSGLQPAQLSLLVIPAFAAAIIGGFSSYWITLVGAILVGIAQSEMGNEIDPTEWPGAPQSLPFIVIVVFLVVRGTGLPVRGYVGERFAAVGSGRIPTRLVLPLTISLSVLMGFVFEPSVNTALTVTFATATMMLSVVVITGYTGQISLAQAALAGIGALVSARLVHAGTPFIVAAIAAIAVATLAGLVFAIPALRTRGVQLAVVTLGLGMVVAAMVFENIRFSGGPDGVNVGKQDLFGFNIDLVEHPGRYSVVTLLTFVLAALAVASVRRGRVGRRLIAVRANERAAASLGVSVVGAKLYAFALGAAIAALGGILFSFRSQTITFDLFPPIESILLVAFTVVGGVGSLVGPVIGATLAAGSIGSYIFDYIITNVNKYLALVGGISLVVFLLQDPDGLAVMNARMLRKPFRFLLKGIEDGGANELAESAETGHRVEPATLEATDITVRFGGVVAVNGVSVSVEPGLIRGVIGPNGAGKTTLIDAITGFVRASDGGSVTMNGVELLGKSVAQRARTGLARSFQSLELFEDMTVLENLRTASEPRDTLSYVTDLAFSRRLPLSPVARAAIHEFGLGEALHLKPSELSYGQRRLLGVARAVAMEPSVLLLDEPASGLGGDETAELAKLVRRLADEWGIAILLIEHDMSFVMSVCDRITVLDFGRPIAEGTVAEIRRNPAVRDAYLGAEHSDASAAQADEALEGEPAAPGQAVGPSQPESGHEGV